MTRSIAKASIVAVAIAIFAIGLFVGRHSVQPTAYDKITSPSETPLLGRWKISNADSLRSAIEFRRDRTAVMYDNRQSATFVSTWGRNGDELWLQNVHICAEPNSFVPPSTLKIVQLGDGSARIQTGDQVDWGLTRM